MPVEIHLPQHDDIRGWRVEDWTNVLFVHFFGLRSGENPGPIVTLNITGEHLRDAARTACSAAEAKAAFISAIKRSAGSYSLGVDASRRSMGWSPRRNTVPPFLSHLLLTCMVANDLSEELSWTGNFRIRLSQILETESQPNLDRLRGMWEELEAWSVRQNVEGAGCRQLRLPEIPDAGYHSIIGYSIRLAVPSRRDQTILATLLQQNGMDGREPERNSVLRVVSAEIGRFSADFKGVFEGFVSALRSQPSAILAQTAFWTAVRNAALANVDKPSSQLSGPRIRLELEDDDGRFWLALTSDTEIRTDRVRALALPTQRQSLYRFLLKDQQDRALADLLFTATTTERGIEKAIAGIRTSVNEGLLLFEETDDYVYVLTTSFPSSGSLRALVSDRLKAAFNAATKAAGIETEITKSGMSGWSEWRGLTADALRELELSRFPALQPVRSLRVTIPPAEIKLRGGIRHGTSFVALPGALPRVEVSEAEQVKVDNAEGTWEVLVREEGTADTWRFPSSLSAAQLLGSHRIVAFAASVPIADRTVNFIETTLSTDYKAPSEPERWLVESTAIDTVTLPDDAVPSRPLTVRQKHRRHSAPAAKKETRPHFIVSEQRSLVSLVSLLCSRFSAQKGISEGEMVQIMTGELGLTPNKVWPALRSWLECGMLDVLSDARWRARIYYARRPQLVVHQRSGSHEAVLTGLVPPYLVERFDNLTAALQLGPVARHSISPFVPPLARCRSYGVGALVELGRELTLPGLEEVRAPEDFLVDVQAAAKQFSSTTNDSWPFFRGWDWKRRSFSEHPAEKTASGISVDWCRREDGPDRYKVYRNGSLVWWTRLRTSAVVTACTLAGVPVFTPEPGAAMTSQGDSLYLPLPAARAVAWTAPANPGPVTLADGSAAYRYVFRDEGSRDSVLSKMWPGSFKVRRSPSPLGAAKLSMILRTAVGPQVPVPVTLRRAIDRACDGHLAENPRMVPLSALPRLYALISASERGEN